tara:strand:+ start:17300 stop:18172 length:873 start_codon:yes stop_codon:yes gene_type:complete
MATNTYFKHNTANNAEQTLINNLVIETIKQVGFDCYYLPRSSNNVDTILQDAERENFSNAYQLEMYFMEPEDSLANSIDYISRFGFEVRDSTDLVFSVSRFEALSIPNYTVPLEGDLIYIPFVGQMYEIKFVEDMTPFMQLGKNYVYQALCRLFIYNDQEFSVNTGTAAIDNAINKIETDRSFKMDLTMGAGSGTYTVGEIVYQGANLGAATAQGEVISWASNKLRIMNISGNFALSTNVIGDSSSASYTLSALNTLEFPNDHSAQNSEIEAYADSGVVDFTESNPFGNF